MTVNRAELRLNWRGGHQDGSQSGVGYMAKPEQIPQHHEPSVRADEVQGGEQARGLDLKIQKRAPIGTFRSETPFRAG